jgi:putative transposase
MNAAVALASDVGVRKACWAFDVPRSTVYRRLKPPVPAARMGGARALTEAERLAVYEALCAERFVDASPAEVHATLLDEGHHLASVSTMYRILRSKRSVRERRPVRRHASYARPELVARGPNEVWTWDITKVRGPERRDWYHLYVIIDLFSRYVVGWFLASQETGALAERFIAETMKKHGVKAGELTLHSDRGASMRSKTVAEMLADIGVVRSHSRPRTSNDNAFSEAQFKTMKYCPFFPGSFTSVAEGRAFFDLFFHWYNEEHHHSGLAMLTPAVVFGGRVDEVVAVRQAAMDVAYGAHPERFVQGRPVVHRPSAEVWINRPNQQLPVVQANPSGAAEPPPEASVRPSPAQSADREVATEATERPEPPGATRSVASMARMARTATLPESPPAVPVRGVGRSEAGEQRRILGEATGQAMGQE